MTMIPVVNGALGTIPKSLIKGLEKLEIREEKKQQKTKTLQHYWDQPEYWGEFWGIKEICCHPDFSERPSTKADVKNLQ